MQMPLVAVARFRDAAKRPAQARRREESYGNPPEARSAASLHRIGEAPVDGNSTVDQAVDLWSTRVLAAPRSAPRTRERYALHCAVIKDGLGSRRLAKLTPDDIEALEVVELLRGCSQVWAMVGMGDGDQGVGSLADGATV